MDDEYGYIIDMYKTKAKAALQFADNIVVWTILPLFIGLIVGYDKLPHVEITFLTLTAIFFVVITPLLLIIFSYLKYKEYNSRWKECVVRSLVSKYAKTVKGEDDLKFHKVVRYIHKITRFSEDEIMTILYRLQQNNNSNF